MNEYTVSFVRGQVIRKLDMVVKANNATELMAICEKLIATIDPTAYVDMVDGADAESIPADWDGMR